MRGSFDLPPYFGRLRVMAAASQGPRFGSGATTVFVRSPLMVQENLPRFLAPGDRAEGPFVAFNNTDKAATAELTAQFEAPLAAADGAQQAKADFGEIAARGQAAKPIAIRAAERAGVGIVRYEARMAEERTSGSVQLPVRPASPYVTLSGFASVVAGTPAKIELPGADFLDGTTTAALVVSGLPTLSLAGGLRYNLAYPWGCAEQTVSAAFPLLYLGDLAAQVDPGRFSADGLKAMVQSAIDRTVGMQTASGGLAMWPGGREPWEWGSLYGAHFLVEAKKAGYEVPAAPLAELLDYTASLLTGSMPDPPENAPAERAYACYVLTLGGRNMRQASERLYEQRNLLGPSARAFLAGACLQSGMETAAAELLKGAGASLTGAGAAEAPRAPGGTLGSPVRDRAVLLFVLLSAKPEAPEVPALAKALMDAQTGGRWATTQDNAFALLALGKLAKVKAATPQDFKGKVTLAGRTRDFDSAHPLTMLGGLAGKTAEISIEGTGSASVFWSVGGVPLKPAPEKSAQGFVVKKRLTNRAGDADLDPGRLVQGQFVVVEIEIQANEDLPNVVIEDLLPAGLEIEDAGLATSEKTGDDEGDNAKDAGGLVVKRTDVRDDRMVAFVDLVKDADGKRVFRYSTRAVTPGTYVLPGCSVEAMYNPAWSGRTAPGTLTVKAR